MVKGGLTVLISVLIIYGVVYASTVKITPPTGTPVATFYSLSEIANFITANTPATEGSPALDWSIALEDTASTTAEIYSALASLISADKVKLGTTYLGTAGTLVPSGGTATTSNVLSGKTYFGDSQTNWTLQTGTMTNNGAFALTASSTDQSVTAGYYSGGTLAGDADLVTGNIKSGITIFGIDGNGNVVDTSAGDAVAGDLANNKIAFVDGSQITGSMFTNQKNQTKDDWVNSGGTVGEYAAEEATWSAVAGSPFAAYTSIDYAATGGSLDLYSGTVKQDTRTGLWWSDIMAVNGGGTASTTDNQFTLSADGARPTGGNAIGFCGALNTANFGGYNDWYLPTQKQLMQSYIDGSANNLPNPDNTFWSSTELYSNAAYAWSVPLHLGSTFYYTKVTSNPVRCVRP